MSSPFATVRVAVFHPLLSRINPAEFGKIRCNFVTNPWSRPHCFHFFNFHTASRHKRGGDLPRNLKRRRAFPFKGESPVDAPPEFG
ncbi:MAG: hypothetical protein WCD16_04770 [Paracoccaceae bacterium]